MRISGLEPYFSANAEAYAAGPMISVVLSMGPNQADDCSVISGESYVKISWTHKDSYV